MQHSNNRVIRGNVSDQVGGIPGASIKVKNTSRGTIADGKGDYAIRASDGEVLVFSFLGYTSLEIAVSQKTLNVTLARNDKQLAEVVVVALGLSRNKNELPYSAQTLSGAEVSSNRNTNVIGELSGKIAGAQIKQANDIGGSTNIVLRGPKSASVRQQPAFVCGRRGSCRQFQQPGAGRNKHGDPEPT